MSVEIYATLGEQHEVAATLSDLRYLVFQGMKGDTGDKGEDGADGEDGTDGVSPTVTVADITGGHRVTITDADGAHTFDVMDGDSAAAENAVLYTAQSLTDEQQEQARENIGIEFMTAAEVDEMWGSIDGIPDGDEVSY